MSLAAAALAVIAWTVQPSERVLVLAGGCFWGVEAVFEHVLGVRSVTSGFARPADAEKGFVPVEAVRIIYDPSRVKPDQLLSIFFTVAHDPSSRDAQGPDEGPEYRAMVLYQSAPDRAVAESSFAALAREKSFPGPIMTELRPFGKFSEAEAYHQDFMAKNPRHPYIVQNDLPKLHQLQSRFPSLYRADRAP
jgi:peptide-methionine (S)-S-oxide reductase